MGDHVGEVRSAQQPAHARRAGSLSSACNRLALLQDRFG